MPKWSMVTNKGLIVHNYILKLSRITWIFSKSWIERTIPMAPHRVTVPRNVLTWQSISENVNHSDSLIIQQTWPRDLPTLDIIPTLPLSRFEHWSFLPNTTYWISEFNSCGQELLESDIWGLFPFGWLQ